MAPVERVTAPAARAPGAFDDGWKLAARYLGFKACAWTAERIPIRLADSIAVAAGKAAWRLSGATRAIVAKNLARVLPGAAPSALPVREAFISYAQYWLETFRIGRYSAEEIRSMVACHGREVLDAKVAEGRGVIAFTAHFGFYDQGLAWVGLHGYPVTTVAEVLRPRVLFDWFRDARQRRGWKVLPATPGAAALRSLHEVLARKEIVCLVAERDLGRRGVWVEFFGERTTFPVGPALLAARTGAPLISAAIHRDESGYHLIFRDVEYARTGDERADIDSIAQVIAGSIEEMVKRAPEQWHLFSPNWPSDEHGLPPRGSKRGTPPPP